MNLCITGIEGLSDYSSFRCNIEFLFCLVSGVESAKHNAAFAYMPFAILLPNYFVSYNIGNNRGPVYDRRNWIHRISLMYALLVDGKPNVEDRSLVNGTTKDFRYVSSLG